jgi:oligoribonuclease NrnB/cAMP/cGMP phosphodiesterase (DHH superfamily)
MIVIHHNKDLDGFSSGAICKLKYPDAKLIGWDYAEPIPDFDQFIDEDVIMIDITFPIQRIDELRKLAKSLTVIDHHISFFKDLRKFYQLEEELAEETKDVIYTDGNLKYIYELGIAACEIGWDFLFPGEKRPEAITLLGKYDTWRGNGTPEWNSDILPFQFYMRTICTSAETFPVSMLEPISWKEAHEGIIAGRLIVKYQEQQDMLACQRSAFETEVFGGLKGLCLNARAFSSETMKSIYNDSKHDIMIGFEYTGKKWTVSLRSIGTKVDCSLIAKARGGGGHKNAAGFEVNNFEDIFK